MEHVNTTAGIRQPQQQPQHIQLQQHHEEQQQQHEHQQQFCLRWHNHQTSLLSTLPVLLDQSHLTDVTISAEGRTLRAHRVVLSACSTFFLELFRALDTTNHPVIIIPGASFAAIVALLTFMYSGEVNVYEEQIPMLLNLAETLGIKGLADVQNNKTTKCPGMDFPDDRKEEPEASPTPPTSTPLPPTAVHTAAALQPLQLSAVLSTPLPPAPLHHHPLSAPQLQGGSKQPSPLESFFLKSLQFYPNLLPQPLNFSQTALNKTSELLAKYQQQCNSFYQGAGVTALGMSAAKELLPQMSKEDYADRAAAAEEAMCGKRICLGEKKTLLATQQLQQQHQHQQQQQQQQKDIKRIDRIVESLRCSNKTPSGLGDGASTAVATPTQMQSQLPPPLNIKTCVSNMCGSYTSPTFTPHLNIAKSSASLMYGSSAAVAVATAVQQQHMAEQYASCSRDAAAANNRNTPDSVGLKNEIMCITPEKQLPTPPPASPQGKSISNSKLYATCFICHKQLSNQYNLRVHLETHQNVRYACNVCSHVSRSKDALRKHVSYRHPGAPSPCETEARRKRACKGLSNTSPPATAAIAAPTSDNSTPTSPSTVSPFQLATSGSSSSSNAPTLDSESQMAAQLSSAYMFLPNQFHLAAAAAAAAQQQQQQQQNQHQHLQNLANATSSTAADFVSNMDAVSSSNSTTVTATSSISTIADTNTAVATLHNNFNIKTEPGVAQAGSSTVDSPIAQHGGGNNSTVIGLGAVAVSNTHCSPSVES